MPARHTKRPAQAVEPGPLLLLLQWQKVIGACKAAVDASIACRPVFAQQLPIHRLELLSATGHEATSLDYLIGAAEQHRWDFETERFRSPEVDTQFEFGRLVKRNVSRRSTLKNITDEVGEATIDVRKVD